MDEKRKAASDFMGTLDGRATQAQQMSQGFSDLRNSVSAFVTDLFNKLATYNQNDMEKQIQALDDAIAKLQTELKALKSTIDALTSQLEALENAIGVSSVLAAFVPAFWIDVAIKTAQAEDVKGQLQQTQKDHECKVTDIANKEAQRASIQANMFSVPLVRAAMEKALPDTDLIQYKIGALATIWAALRADTQAIVEKLDYASDTNSQTLFKARVRTASGMYSTLQTALETYKDYISSNLNLRSTLKQFHVDPDTGAVTPRTTDIPLPTTDTTSAAGSA
ncbi:hypothetical protein K474DRAFT_97918 [Panus rudis PR-1116 ss-1]|nr:hypothetical protein K474DRAFT_97918 [Panus rudis PR-1116 ss-1]